MFAAPLAAAACHGFYAYIPRNIEQETAFTVEVQPTAIEVLFVDYSNVFARRQNVSPSRINFSESQFPGLWTLTCDAVGATLRMPAQGSEPGRTVRLIRARGDIWSIARQRGWNVGD